MGYYSDLLANNGPWVTFERCTERAFAALFEHFRDDFNDDEPLSAATIYEGHRGLPKVFGSWKTNGEDADSFGEVVAAVSQILLLATGREDEEGEEICELAVIVVTAAHDGDSAAQLERHESWVAAARGILSDGANEEGVTIACLNAAEAPVCFTGIERKEGPAEFEFTAGRWISTERWIVRGFRTADAS